MNRFFTLLLASSCLTAVGQVTYPYNPDGNADGDIAVGDLQDFLGTYGNPFIPSEIMVGDTMLSDWVYFLSSTLLDQQVVISNLQSQFAGLNDVGGANIEGLAFGLRQSFNPWLQNFDTLETYKLYTTIDFMQDGFLSFDVSCGNATFLLLPDSISSSDYSSDFFLEQSAIRKVEFPNREEGIPIKSSECGVIVKSTCCSCLDLDWNWLPLSPSTSSEIDSLSNVIAQLDSIVQIIEPFLGCTDPEACNYDFAVIDAGNCQYFDCLGVCGGEAQLDECGVCNGSGPSIPIIESIEILYDSVYAEPIDDWFVFEVGVDTTFTFVCEIIEGCTDENAPNFSPLANLNEGCIYYEGCGDLSSISYHGTTYSLIDINGQCWFQSNLATTQFQDGAGISQVSESQWQTLSDYNNEELTIQYPAYAVPPCDNSCSANGYVYNSLVWNSENEVCPSGFRMPVKSDFEFLIEPYSEDLGELKATWGWGGAGAYNASNESGFNAIATGTVGGSYSGNQTSFNGPSSYSRFAFKEEDATFHSSETLILTQYEYSNGITNEHLGIGRSIRCIKD